MDSKMLYYYHQFLLCYSLSVPLFHSIPKQSNKYCGCNSVHYSDLRSRSRRGNNLLRRNKCFNFKVHESP